MHCCGHSHGLRSCSEWQPPVPSSLNRKTMLLPPSIIGWGSILLRSTMQVLLGSCCLKHIPYGPAAHPIRVFCFLPLHAHLAFQIELCPEDDNLAQPSHSWGTSPAACSAFKIQAICSVRRVSSRTSKVTARLPHEQLLPHHPQAGAWPP